LGNILNPKPKDSTKANAPKTNDIKTQAGNAIKDLFGKKKAPAKTEPGKTAPTPAK
jgi:hypothetical protein